MEQLSIFISIVIINFVLSGDNAMVIAMASRSLPPPLQKKAIVLGSVGAIGLRVILTALIAIILTCLLYTSSYTKTNAIILKAVDLHIHRFFAIIDTNCPALLNNSCLLYTSRCV